MTISSEEAMREARNVERAVRLRSLKLGRLTTQDMNHAYETARNMFGIYGIELDQPCVAGTIVALIDMLAVVKTDIPRHRFRKRAREEKTFWGVFFTAAGIALDKSEIE